MWRIKRSLSILIVAFLFLTGCSESAEKASADAEQTESAAEDKSQYLDTEILGKESTQIYEKYTVTYGTFTEGSATRTVQGYMSRYVPNPVVAEVDAGTMTVMNIDEFYGPHKEGDPLILVETEVDATEILKAKQELQRLTERYARDSQEFLAQREKDIFKNDQIGDKYEFAAGCILLERNVLEWEYVARLYEQQIQDAKQNVQTLEQAAAVTSINAPVRSDYSSRNGYAGNVEPLYSGTKIKDGDLLGYRYSFDKLFFILEQDGTYRYGMKTLWEASVSQGTENLGPTELECYVANATPDDLYGNLDKEETDVVYFDINTEALEGEGDGYGYSSPRPSESLGEMKNVLLVPKAAVTEKSGVCYVTLVKEDGSFLKTGFIAGGSNSEYYWVLEGLKEGDVIYVEN